MSQPYPIPLTAQTVADFRADGFVKTEGVLSAEEIERYGTAVDQEVAERTANDARSLSEKSRYEQSFIQCMRLWETCPEVLPLSCHAGLGGIAAQLLGVDSVRMWQDQALYKEPGGKETTPHQDETFWAVGDEPLVSAWIPFDDVAADSGAMAYVPGSHQAGILKVVDITHHSEPYAILDDPALQGRRPQIVPAEAGSVIWHHGLTVHQASANRTDRTRRVFTVVYIASNARRIKSWPTYPLDREQIEVGEVMRGDSMPVLWPATAELPTPPELVGERTGPQYKLP